MEAGTEVRPYPVGVFSAYGNGWRQLWKFFLVLFLIGLIYFVINIAVSIVTSIPQSAGISEPIYSGIALAGWLGIWTLISWAIYIFFISPLSYGQSFAYLKAARGNKVEVPDLFAAFKNYWSAVGAAILVGIIVGIASIFLIVPGIYFSCKLAFVPYLIVDKRMRVSEAFRASWRMASHGRAWKVFLIGLLSIPIVIAGIIVLVVGVIISFMWISAAFASLYHAIDMEQAPEITVIEGPIIG